MPTFTVDDPLTVTLVAADVGGGDVGGGATGVCDSSVTVRLCETVGLAVLVAMIVTVAGVGIVSGAVYSPSAEINPTVVFPPATPLTVQVTAVLDVPLTVAVYCAGASSVTLVAPLSAIVTVAAGGVGVLGAAIKVTVMLCEVEALATLVAVMVTVAGCGIVAGAVYSPVDEINPAAALPPATPSTLQVTAWFVVPLTAAVYCVCVPTVTLVAPLSAIVTGAAGGVGVLGAATSVTVMLCEVEALATLVAVMVTVAGCGIVAGAVYSPVDEINPAAALPPATPSTLQVTAWFVVPLTAAVYCACVPTVTLVAPLSAIVTGVDAGRIVAGATRVTATLCEVAVLSALVALIVMLADAGIVAGAL
ncbi:MAG TPA: hypothetical protein VGM02_07740 [Acidobacteriaceae bacterium]